MKINDYKLAIDQLKGEREREEQEKNRFLQLYNNQGDIVIGLEAIKSNLEGEIRRLEDELELKENKINDLCEYQLKLQEEIFKKNKELFNFEDKIAKVKKEVEKRDRKITNQEELIELSKRNLDECSKELAEKRELINQLKEVSESP